MRIQLTDLDLANTSVADLKLAAYVHVGNVRVGRVIGLALDEGEDKARVSALIEVDGAEVFEG